MASALAKGKGKAVEGVDGPEDSDDAASSLSSSSSSTSDSELDSDTEEDVSQEFLDGLLEKAKKNLEALAAAKRSASLPEGEAEDVLMLDMNKPDELSPAIRIMCLLIAMLSILLLYRSIPRLDPGPSLPLPYFKLGEDRKRAPTLVRDPDTERVDKLASTSSIAKTLPPPAELSKKTGLPLTKAEKKAVRRSPIFIAISVHPLIRNSSRRQRQVPNGLTCLRLQKPIFLALRVKSRL